LKVFGQGLQFEGQEGLLNRGYDFFNQVLLLVLFLGRGGIQNGSQVCDDLLHWWARVLTDVTAGGRYGVFKGTHRAVIDGWSYLFLSWGFLLLNFLLRLFLLIFIVFIFDLL
jgi:hypothetical protein